MFGIDSAQLRATLNGSGTMRLHGRTEQIVLELGGAGTLDAGGCSASVAQVRLSGAGTLSVNASTEVSGQLTGAGTLRLVGVPVHERLTTTGVVHIQRGN